MLIATFGPTTAWVGKTITREGDSFILEGHGPITATDVMDYDRRGQLVWASDGVRAWVGSRARSASDSRIASSPVLPTAQQTSLDASASAAGGAGRWPLSPALTRIIIACMVGAIVVAAIVVLTGRHSSSPGASNPGGSQSQAAVTPTPAATSQWVQVATISGSAGDTIVESPSASSFELKGTNQRLDYRVTGNATADLPLGINVYVFDTRVNYEYGHVISDAKVVASGESSVFLHKQPGTYYLHVSALRCNWQVALFEQR